MKLYTALLRLYPRQFRQEFAAEMQTVFADALHGAQQTGGWAMLKLCGRELGELPKALAREHWLTSAEKGTDMANSTPFIAQGNSPSSIFKELPVRNWWHIFMAVLPFVLILATDILPSLLGTTGLLAWDSATMQAVNVGLGILMVGAFLVAFFLARRRKWPLWSATWYTLFAATPLFLISGLITILSGERYIFQLGQSIIYLVTPLGLAILLYVVARRRPLRELLTTLPLLYLLWLGNLEFVPNSIQIAIKIPSIALICLTIAFMLRKGSWQIGLFAILAMNLVVGVLFCYAGIYHGGSLPGFAAGPSWVEVARSLLPQYLALSAILLGPLFARKIRQIGRSGGSVGEFGYHVALAGLLLVILANLAGVGFLPPSGRISASFQFVQLIGILLGLGAYLLGLFLLFSDTAFGWSVPEWAGRILLALLPLAIPVVFELPFITSKWPLSNLYGISLLWKLPHFVSLSIGLVWLGLSVWVVMQDLELPPTRAVVRSAPVTPPAG